MVYGFGELPTRDELAAQIFASMIANYDASLTSDHKPGRRLNGMHAKAYMIADWWLLQPAPPAWTPPAPPAPPPTP